MRFVLGMFLLCAGLAGCGSNALEFEQAAVKGQVLYQGKPLEKGLIRFLPDTEVVQGQVAGKPVFASIVDGTYEISAEKGATVGKNRVEITSFRKTGKKTQMEDTVVEEEVQFLPADYNTSSSLTADIQPGENEQNFDLK